MNLTKILVFCMALNLTACFTAGQEFSSSRVSEIKIGETTEQQISEIFGTPWRRGIENGYKTWTYGFHQYFLIGDVESEDLVVRFDEQGIVKSYNFNTSRK